MVSYTLTLSGNTTILNAEYFPPIVLNGNYECGLVDFQSFYTIANIDSTNNKFHYGKNHSIEIPEGSYEIEDIEKYILQKINEKQRDTTTTITIKPNNNTLKCNIQCSKVIHFDRDNSIGSLLGFTKKELSAGRLHESDLPVDILKVSTIRIECSITSNAYLNSDRVHTIHEFSPNVAPGYKLSETPNTVIYLPVAIPSIDSVTIRIVDQNNNLINFHGENISIRLHLRSC